MVDLIKMDSEQLNEVYNLKSNKGLSIYDKMAYVVAARNNYILATADNLLRKFAMENKVVVYRVLKIIDYMYEQKVISIEEKRFALTTLLNDDKSFIPKEEIEKELQQITK